MNNIYDNLWLGDISDAREQSLSEFGIDKVITVCQDAVDDNVGCSYTHYNMSDGPDNKYGGDHSFSIYKDATDELYQDLNTGQTVFIHCHRGRSRSVAVSVGAIARLSGMSVEDSLTHVKTNRPEADPDPLLIDHAELYVNQYRQA